MNLYMIALPTRTNAGADYSAALGQWEGFALTVAGGFTRRPDGDGHWIDGGKLYAERMACYHVACGRDDWRKLVAFAFECFPDQLAIFHAFIGLATIEGRPEKSNVA